MKYSIAAATVLLVAWSTQQLVFDHFDRRLNELERAEDRARGFLDHYSDVDLAALFGPDSALTAQKLDARRQFARYLTALAKPIEAVPSVGPPLVALGWWSRGEVSPWGAKLPMPGSAIERIMGTFGWELQRVKLLRTLSWWGYVALNVLGSVLGIRAVALPQIDPARVRLPEARMNDNRADTGPQL